MTHAADNYKELPAVRGGRKSLHLTGKKNNVAKDQRYVNVNLSGQSICTNTS